jgi:hypothetical protein
MTLVEAMAVAARGETLRLPEEEVGDRAAPPPLNLRDQTLLVSQEDIDAMPTAYETAAAIHMDAGVDMLEKIATTGRGGGSLR